MEPHLAIGAPPQIDPSLIALARTALAEYQGDHIIEEDSAYRLGCLAAAGVDYDLEDLVRKAEFVTTPPHFADMAAGERNKVTSILEAEEFLDGYVGIRIVAIDAAYKLACLATGLGCSLQDLVDGQMKRQVDKIISPTSTNLLPPPRREVVDKFIPLAVAVKCSILAYALLGIGMVGAKMFEMADVTWLMALFPLYGLPIHFLLAQMWSGGCNQFAALASEIGVEAKNAQRLDRFRKLSGFCIIFGPFLTMIAVADILPLPWWAILAVLCWGAGVFGSSTAKQIRKHIALGRPGRME